MLSFLRQTIVATIFKSENSVLMNSQRLGIRRLARSGWSQQKLEQLQILYGSQSGTSLMFAKELAENSTNDLNIPGETVDLNEFDPQLLRKPNTLNVFVVSSFGKGEPTDNAKGFDAWLHQQKPEEGVLRNVPFAVFGCGKSCSYPQNYQAFPKYVEHRLQELGAVRLLDRGEGDDSDDIEEDFRKWYESTFKPRLSHLLQNPEEINSLSSSSLTSSSTSSSSTSSSSTSSLSSTSSSSSTLTDESTNQSLTNQNIITNADDTKPTAHQLDDPFAVIELAKTENMIFENAKVLDKVNSIPSRKYSANAPYMAPISQIITLTAPEHLMKVYKQFDFDLSGADPEGVEYETGDYLGVIPSNLKSVDTILKTLHLNGDYVIQREGPKGNFKDIPRLPSEFTLREALTHYFDIRTPPKRYILKILAEHANNPFERRTLMHLAESSEESLAFYRQFVVRDNRGMGSLLRDFPSIRLPAEVLLSKMGPMKPRYYSIANQAKDHSGKKASICMGLLNMPAPDGRPFYGVNSRYMNSITVGSHVPIFIQKSTIRLPEDRTEPAILVGIGSGMSLLRSFYLDRCTSDEPTGPTLLFYGCNGPTDHLYKKEIDGLKNLQAFHSYTFDLDNPTYIQFEFQKQGRYICDLITMDNGSLYICGSPALRTAIRDVLASIFRRHAGMSYNEARTYIKFLLDSGRLVEEAFN